MEVDGVITWVDGSDQSWRRLRSRYQEAPWAELPRRPAASSYSGEADVISSPHSPGLSQQRFRSRDELRFCLRSIEQNMPWLRHIHLVTAGQRPEWLDDCNPRIRVVAHSDIFPDLSSLPTFNSNAIETTLHRIPGLADHFIYFNDDFFVGRPCTIGDFIDDTGHHRLFVERELGLPFDMADQNGLWHAWAFTVSLLQGLVEENAVWRVPSHTPQLYSRDALAALEKKWLTEFDATRRHRFRSPFDVIIRVLYTYAHQITRPNSRITPSKSKSKIVSLSKEDYAFAMLGHPDQDYFSVLAEILLRSPRFFCLNDDTDSLQAGSPVTSRIETTMSRILSILFPHPSSFERLNRP